MKQRLQRAFIVAWIALALAGALDHTIAQRVLGRTIDLRLPHLQYGYVMFNANPHRVPVLTYAHAGGERHDAAELDPARRSAMRARASRSTRCSTRSTCATSATATCASKDDAITIYVDGYDIDLNRDKPTITSTVTCDARPPR